MNIENIFISCTKTATNKQLGYSIYKCPHKNNRFMYYRYYFDNQYVYNKIREMGDDETLMEFDNKLYKKLEDLD